MSMKERPQRSLQKSRTRTWWRTRSFIHSLPEFFIVVLWRMNFPPLRWHVKIMDSKLAHAPTHALTQSEWCTVQAKWIWTNYPQPKEMESLHVWQELLVTWWTCSCDLTLTSHLIKCCCFCFCFSLLGMFLLLKCCDFEGKAQKTVSNSTCH